jgi:hypothetical protein
LQERRRAHWRSVLFKPKGEPFATGIFYASARQFNYLFDDRISTQLEPLQSPPLRHDEQPPLTSNFTDLTINWVMKLTFQL